MDFMKVFDQAVREIKREVNLKVLNVPEIEQKVLDATSTEPWGPHGSALSEIARATKKFTECSIIMNVLWTRLCETGANWRHVYKALTVIEYLIANGSERAVDDIMEHTYKISSLSGFVYVEPNGKDAGINVRKKAETLAALLNDKEKVQMVRNKAAANRDKYVGLSSSGVTYKSSASSYGSSLSGDRYGGFGSSKEGDSFKDSYKDSEEYEKETKWNNEKKNFKSKEGIKLEKGDANHAGGHDSTRGNSSKIAIKPGQISSSSSPSVQPIGDDDFDDFDPRGSSKTNNITSIQVDLFGESLVGDLMDAPPSSSTEASTLNDNMTPEVDLFADAIFVSASSRAEATTGSHIQGDIDFFTSPPDFPAPVPTNVDLFAASDFGIAAETKSSSPVTTNTDAFDPFVASDSGVSSEVKPSTLEPTNTKNFDPFAGISMNNFEGTDLFGDFTSHTEQATPEPPQNSMNSLNNLDQTFVTSSKPAPKKDSFQVKSGIWADSLSRGLIDLNITATKKTNLADIGIVGGLGDVSDDKEMFPPTAFYKGTAMGAGSGLGRSGFTSSTMRGVGTSRPLGSNSMDA